MKSKWLSATVVLLILSLLLVGIGGNLYNQSLAKQEEEGVSISADTRYLSNFSENTIMDVQIIINENDLQSIFDNAMETEYKDATVLINGEKISHVAIRAKGNITLSSVASSESDRYSFKLDFGQYIDGQTYLGLDRLNLNNNFSDPSYMREYLAYQLLNEMGIKSPAATFAKVSINGEYYGLYTAVEDVRESFLARSFENSTEGTLFKPEGIGADLVYIDDDFDSYSGIEKKIQGSNDAEEKFLDFLTVINSDNPTKEELESVLDVDSFLRYTAINTALVNMDSYFGNQQHNYYLYEKDGKITVVPWDYNMAFDGYPGQAAAAATTSGATESGEDAVAAQYNYLYIDTPLSGITMEQRPLLNAVFSIDEYQDRYNNYLQEIIDGPFSVENMRDRIATIDALISSLVETDPTAFYDYEDYQEAVALEASTEIKPKQQFGAFGNVATASSATSADTTNIPPDGNMNAMNGKQGMAPPNGNMNAMDGKQGMVPPDGNMNVMNSEQGMPFENIASASGEQGVMPGGMDMMMQSEQVPLMTFITYWNQNIQKQLDGELPSTGDTQGSGMGRGGPGGGMLFENIASGSGEIGIEMPFGDGEGGMPFPGNMEGGFPPGGGGPPGMPGMGKQGKVSVSTIICVSVAVVVVIAFVLFLKFRGGRHKL